ncbi:MAG TPA: DUF3717 domain-containing protein [Telluria sp.]|jgi:hypothetical protein
MDLSVQELEAAINYWRDRRPARGNEFALSPEVNLLAGVYAMMIYRRQAAVDLAALEMGVQRLLQDWRAQ